MAGKSRLEEFKQLLVVGGLPDLGPGPRAEVLSTEELSAKLGLLLEGGKLPPVSRDLIKGLIMLWHDQMDPAHEIAQAIENADGSFLHGIIHRREPDYGNATYWFRRVGGHPCYPEIAKKVEGLLGSKDNPALQKQLIPGGKWEPFVFIGLCEKAFGRPPNDGQTEVLREIQGIETEVFLEYLLNDR
jgi:hypothetical protein